MTQAKHTPGPWIVRANNDGNPTITTDEHGPWFIAELCLGIEVDGVDQAEANARLIALAPELLEYVASSASAGCATAAALIAKLAVTAGEGTK